MRSKFKTTRNKYPYLRRSFFDLKIELHIDRGSRRCRFRIGQSRNGYAVTRNDFPRNAKSARHFDLRADNLPVPTTWTVVEAAPRSRRRRTAEASQQIKASASVHPSVEHSEFLSDLAEAHDALTSLLAPRLLPDLRRLKTPLICFALPSLEPIRAAAPSWRPQ